MSYKMRKSFTMERKDEDGNLVKEKFTYIPYEKLDFACLKLSGDKFRFGILKVACAFDIETTSYYSAKYDKDLATMYIWQLGLNKDTIIGRTWEEFVELLDLISDHAARFDGTIICLIQNLSFEFQFIKSILKWNTNKEGYPDIFAKDDRTILYARYKNIEFRDTLALTGMSLKRFKKNYNLDVGKLDGDLDYSLPRHYKTTVTNRELAYCINDVQVLTDFFYKYLFPTYIKPGIKIPLTSTGIVRADIKSEFMAIPKEERKKLLNRINNAQPTEEVYKLWRNFLFRGGLVHASTIACNYLWEDEFGSLDLKSAHPGQMLAKKFPWKYNRRNKSDFPKILQQARSGDYGFFGVFNRLGLVLFILAVARVVRLILIRLVHVYVRTTYGITVFARKLAKGFNGFFYVKSYFTLAMNLRPVGGKVVFVHKRPYERNLCVLFYRQKLIVVFKKRAAFAYRFARNCSVSGSFGFGNNVAAFKISVRVFEKS